MVKCVECESCYGYGENLIDEKVCDDCQGLCHKMIKVPTKRKRKR